MKVMSLSFKLLVRTYTTSCDTVGVKSMKYSINNKHWVPCLDPLATYSHPELGIKYKDVGRSN